VQSETRYLAYFRNKQRPNQEFRVSVSSNGLPERDFKGIRFWQPGQEVELSWGMSQRRARDIAPSLSPDCSPCRPYRCPAASGALPPARQ